MSESYSDELVVALRLRDVPGERIGQVGGAALLVGGLCLVTVLNRDPVVDPRTGRDRYPRAMVGPLRRPGGTVRRRGEG